MGHVAGLLKSDFTITLETVQNWITAFSMAPDLTIPISCKCELVPESAHPDFPTSGQKL